MANVFLNDLKLQKVWDAIRKNFYPVPPESGTAQPPTPAMEGDITIAFGRYTSGQYQGYFNSIVSTIGDGKVTTSKLADSAVTKAKLATGAIDPVVTWGNGTTAGPTITIRAGKDTSVSKAVPVATAIYSGVITTTTQTVSGDKTFKGNILSEQNIEALYGMSAHGHADLSIAAGGGVGTVTCISVNDAVKEPDGTGMITLDDYPTLTVYNADKTQINSAISQINSKIPIAATASNQLADKEFVNSSINTATATFRGTYTAASDTEAAAQTALAGITTKDLNDYAFVKVENTPQTGVDKYKRYKYNGNNWVYEYTLNNSSFTASQWDAINSTITSAKVDAFNAKYDKPSGGIPKSDLASDVRISLGKADSALQRSNFVSIGDHDTPVYFDASGYGQVIDALSIPGNIESTGGGVAAHGHAELSVSAGGGSGTTTAVRIGNGSPIEAVDGVVTIPTAQISQQPDGTIALGGVAIAVKGLGSFAYRSSINLTEVVGATDVVSSLSNAIGQTHAMAEDNSENIAAHDERILDLESYFDGASAKYALDSDKVDGHHYSELVTAIGISGKTITWSKGDTAQTPITVPYAKESTTLETESLTNQEFIFRNSPKTIGADSLKLDRIFGRTVVWNQLAAIASTSKTGTYRSISLTDYRDGTYKLNGTADSNTSIYITLGQNTCYENHKYYISVGHSNGQLSFDIGGYSNWYQTPATNTSKIATCKTTYTGTFELTLGSIGTVYDNFMVYPIFVDLTLLYGANAISGLTDAQLIAKFEKDYQGYHSYNPGQLINNAAEGLETVGFNLWDEEWINGYVGNNGELIYGSGHAVTNLIPVIGGNSYYWNEGYHPTNGYIVGYDSSLNYLGLLATIATSASFTMPQNCSYVRIQYNGSFNTVINYKFNFNLSDPNRNGQYEPYKRNVLDLHLEEFEVKDSQGNIITITGGLGDADNQRDEIIAGTRFIKRTAVRAYQSGDESDTTVKTDGTNTRYALATPETYELVSPIPTAMPAGTTERRLPEDTSDSVLAPFCADTTYGTNPGDILASGIAWEKIWGRPTIAHDKSNVSLTTLDRHVIKIGDKELYLIFSVGSDGTSYTLRVATGLNNGVYENEQVFNFATIDDTTINNICHL